MIVQTIVDYMFDTFISIQMITNVRLTFSLKRNILMVQHWFRCLFCFISEQTVLFSNSNSNVDDKNSALLHLHTSLCYLINYSALFLLNFFANVLKLEFGVFYFTLCRAILIKLVFVYFLYWINICSEDITDSCSTVKFFFRK